MHRSHRVSPHSFTLLGCALGVLAVALPAQSKDPPMKATREAWIHTIALELAKAADIDHDGKIVAPEWEAFANTLVVDDTGKVDRARIPVRIEGFMKPIVDALLDFDGDGKVTAGDLWQIVRTLDANGDGSIDRAELGALPWPGDRAPDFELSCLGDDEKRVKLSSFATHKPVALIFSNYTCGSCRESVGRVVETYEKHKADVEFLVVYVHEAALAADSAETLQDRKRNVAKSVEELHSPIPAAVDELDGRVDRAYGGAPLRLYLVGLDGTIVYAGGEGPHLFWPDELEAAIRTELAKTHR